MSELLAMNEMFKLLREKDEPENETRTGRPPRETEPRPEDG